MNPPSESLVDWPRSRDKIETRLQPLRERVETVDPQIHALVPEANRWERIEHDWERAADRLAAEFRGDLVGVPVGIKDIIHVDGLPTQAGSELPPAELAGPQAAVVDVLEGQGAIVLGKTVTTEFALTHPGPTRNPINRAHTPGGSSSGSAAAVAAGLCPLALGTQSVGSIIRPAAFCGVVGFKPSFGRVPTDGVIPLAPSADHLGTFTRDVGSARIAARHLCPHWEDVPRDPGTPVLGIPDAAYIEQASPTAVTQFRETIDRLERAGLTVVESPILAEPKAIIDRHFTLVEAETAITHAHRYATFHDAYHPDTREVIESGRTNDIAMVGDARAGQLDLRQSIAEAAANVDIFVSPAACGVAPKGLETTGNPAMNIPWTHAGVPAITIPHGSDDDTGLPYGLQCAAAFGADEILIAHAERLERILA